MKRILINECKSIGTHLVAIYVKNDVITNFYRIRAYHLIKCGYFIDIMLNKKNPAGSTNLFSSNNL